MRTTIKKTTAFVSRCADYARSAHYSEAAASIATKDTDPFRTARRFAIPNAAVLRHRCRMRYAWLAPGGANSA